MPDVPISDIANVSVSVSSGATAQQGFGVPMLIGQTSLLGATILEASSVQDWVDAGGLTTDPEYLALSAMFSQQPTVQTCKVSERSADVSGQQRVTFAADFLAADTVNITYTYVDLAGATQTESVAVPFNASHAQTITDVTAALLLLTAVTAAVGADAGPGATFTLTVDPALIRSGAVTFTVMSTTGGGGSLQTGTDSVIVTPVTLSDDLAALVGVSGGEDWYALLLTHEGTDNQRNMDTYRAAVWVEANTIDCIHVAQNDQAALPAGTAGNIAKVLEAAGYNRTHVFYHTEAEYADAALAGRMLSQNLDVNSVDWWLTRLAGITAADYTSTQRSTMDGDKIGYYTTIGNIGRYFGGIMASGRFIDQQLTVDWFGARVAEDFLGYFARGADSNIRRSYTDGTTADLEGLLRGQWANGVRANHFAETVEDANGDDVSGLEVSRGLVSAESASNKTNRIYTGMSATVQLAGGIRKVNPVTIRLEAS